MLLLRDLPRYETLVRHAARYPEVDPKATESLLVLLRTSSDVMEAFEEHLSSFNLSQGRFTVLALLNRDPATPLTPADLARRAGVTRATMTGLLDSLEDEGLITRTGQTEDRRKVSVALTDKAHGLLGRMMPAYFRKTRAAMALLADAERDQLIALMRKLEAGLRLSEQAPPAATSS